MVQDANLEYDPCDIPSLTQSVPAGDAAVVFGSRFIGGPNRVLYFCHIAANRGLTLMSNMLNDLNLTDMDNGYKAFRAEVVKTLVIEEERLSVEPAAIFCIARYGLRRGKPR